MNLLLSIAPQSPILTRTPRAKLTRRLGWLLGVSSILLLTILLMLGLAITHMTERLAHDQLVANVDKVREIIDEQSRDLALNLADYACWDATVNNVEHTDSAWCESNFRDFMGRVLQIDLVIMMDRKGVVKYRQGDLPDYVPNQTAPDSALYSISAARPFYEGVWKHGGDFYMIAGSGVYHDGSRGFGDQAHGVLVAGYRLNEEHLTRLSGLVHEYLTLCELDGQIRPIVSPRMSDIHGKKLSGLCVVQGIRDEPAAFMQVTSSFAELDKLHASIYLILNIVAIFTLLGGVIIIRIVRIRVQRPLENLQKALQRFHLGESVDWHHLVHSGDEFEELCNAFGRVSDALRDSQHSLLAVVEGAADAVVVADPSGRIKLANLKARELFGLTIQDRGKLHMLALVSQDQRGALKRHIRTLRHSKAVCEELSILSASGETIQAEVNSIVLDDGRYYASVRDITRRKQVEAALRASEENLRKMADVLPSVLWMMTADHQRILYVSPACDTVYGYSTEEIYADSQLWMKTIHPEDLPHVLDRIEYSHGTQFEIEHRIIHRDGGMRWVQERISPVLDDEGQLIRMIGLTEDITDRKNADLELRASEERYRTLVESQTEGVISADIEERFNFANSAAERILGVQPGELIGMSFRDFTSAEQYAEICRQTESRRGGKRGSYELVISRPDGDQRNIVITGNPRFDEQGELIGTFGVFEDITERKQAEAGLKASESLLRATLESTGDGILVVNAEGRVTHANARYAEMWGIPSSMLDQGSDHRWQALIREQLEYPDEYEARMRELYNSDEHEMDCIPFKDGRAFERYSCPLMQEGKIVGRVWSFRDISESRRSEVALRESEERFRNLADTAPVLIWMAGVDRHCYYFNKTWISFTGRSMQHEYGKGWMKGVHPDDVKRCIDTYNTAFKTQRAFTMEFRLGHADGTYHWLLDTGTPRRTADGRFTGYIGTCTDITDRKSAEEAMREGEQRLQAIFQTAPDGILLKNINRQYTHVNPSIERLLGVQAAELIGHTDDEFFGADAAEHIRKTDERALGGELVEDQNVHLIQGKSVTVSVIKVPVRDDAGRITGLCAIARDISKQQLTSEKRLKDEPYFSTLFEQIGTGVFIVDAATLTIADANPEALRLLDANKSAVIGARLETFLEEVRTPTGVPSAERGESASTHRTMLNRQGQQLPVVASEVQTTLGDRNLLLISVVSVTDETKHHPQASARNLEALALQIREGIQQSIPPAAGERVKPTEIRGYSKL